MHGANETAQTDRIFQIFHVPVGQVDGGAVIEHQKNTCNREYKEEEERQAA